MSLLFRGPGSFSLESVVKEWVAVVLAVLNHYQEIRNQKILICLESSGSGFKAAGKVASLLSRCCSNGSFGAQDLIPIVSFSINPCLGEGLILELKEDL